MKTETLTIKYQFPDFWEQDVARFAKEHYGLEAVIRHLPSERDRNFYLQTDDGREFVLKIANAAEHWDTLDLQNKALEHLASAAPTLALPRVCATKAGDTITTVASRDGAEHLMRMLTWVPGKLWAKVNPHTPKLLRSLGQVLATLDKALQSFSHPLAVRELKWDLKNTGWIREYFHYIENLERRQMVERFYAYFEKEVVTTFPALRASVIYNDANDYNVLVSDADPRDRSVVGVIDFGDMTHSFTVCELAIAAAYAIMDKPDPIAAAAQIVAGYNEVLPLTEKELEVLFPLICARLSISVTNSAYQQQVEPNNEYLLISERSAWNLLEKFSQVNPQFAHYTFREACGLPPCPRTYGVVRWLEENANKIGRIVEPEMTDENLIIFDLSISSLELGNLADVSDVKRFTKRLFKRMKAEKASVGIGRYNEARALYTSDNFKVESNEGFVGRTIHLGLDIFMEAESSVFAPLDGVVHSFQNNAAPLDYGPTIILQHKVSGKALTFFTLYGHLSEDSLEKLYEGKEIKQGERLAKIGDYPVNGGWPPHLHFQIITDLLGKAGDFPGVALPAERQVMLSVSPDPNLLARIPPHLFPVEAMTGEQILASREQRVGKNLSISYEQPLEIVRGFMQYLYDENGRAYLDAVNNVPHVGHTHPRVVRAGQAQMEVLNTNTRYLHENLVRYTERLSAKLPEPLSVCFLVNSGSEANDLALRLARAHTRRKGVVVVDAAYHGNLTSLIEISPYKNEGRGGVGAPPYVEKISLPDVYRGAYKKDDVQAGAKYAAGVVEAIERLKGNGSEVAAFICESLLGCGGQIVLPDNFLQEAYRHTREAGGVCIADEVQVGFGRVGSHFWAFATQEVVPDILTLGKPIGNGHPLAAVITTQEIAASFDNGMEYFNTFGGNPVSCAIGLAVLEVIEEEGLQENALVVGEHLLNGLRGLMEKHQLIGDVRGLGLFIGIELVLNRQTLEPAPEQASYITNRMKERGILSSTDGPLHNVLKIKPPMVFTKENAEFFIATLDTIMQEDFVVVKQK